MQCCVPFCKSTLSVSTSEGISYHGVPTARRLRAAWLGALGMLDSPLPDCAVVCSLHFLNEDLYRTESGSVEVGADAIPAAVQFCMICLNTKGKIVSMKKHKLSRAYKNLTGYTMCEAGHLRQTLCVQCAHRLNTFSKFRDKSLRACSVMMDLFKKHELITIRHMENIHRDNTHLNTDIGTTKLEPNYCDLYICEYAVGDKKTALGEHEYAVGDKKTALDELKYTVGDKKIALGEHEYAVGDKNIALDEHKYAVGDKKTAVGKHKYAVRDKKTTLDELKYTVGDKKIALDEHKYAVGDKKTALGEHKYAVGDKKTALGEHKYAVRDKKTASEEHASKYAVEIPIVKEKENVSDAHQTYPNVNPSKINEDKRDNGDDFSDDDLLADRLTLAKLSDDSAANVLSSDSCNAASPCEVPTTETLQPVAKKAKVNNPNVSLTEQSETACLNSDSKVQCESSSASYQFICDVCQRTYEQKSSLVKHMRSHTDKPQFSCGVCEYKCKFRSLMVMHMRVHTGQKPFSCDLCEYKFSRKSSLTYHMRVHTGERAFACALCEFRSAHKHNLANHMRAHTGEKSFACELCEFRCARKSSLAMHQRVHTGEKPFACKLCEYKCSSRCSLTKHMRRLKHSLS